MSVTMDIHLNLIHVLILSLFYDELPFRIVILTIFNVYGQKKKEHDLKRIEVHDYKH